MVDQYLDVVRLEALSERDQQRVREAEWLDRQARLLLDAGRALPNEQELVALEVEQARLDADEGTEQLTHARAVLAQLIGDDGDDAALRVDASSLPSVRASAEDPNAALANAPELRILALRQRMEEVTLDAARAGRYPTLAVRGGYFHYGTKRFSAFEQEVAIGVDLKMPVFDGFEASANIDRATKAAEAARLRYQSVHEEKRVRAERARASGRRRREAAGVGRAARQDRGRAPAARRRQPEGPARLGGGGAVGPRRREPRRPRARGSATGQRAGLGGVAEGTRASRGGVGRRRRGGAGGGQGMTRTWRRALWLLPLLVLVVTVRAYCGRNTAPSVQTVAAKRAPLRVVVSTNGKVEPVDDIEVRARLDGRVVNIPDPGKVVAAGDEMVRFDDGPVAAQVAAAESERLAAIESLRVARATAAERRERLTTDRALQREGALTREVLTTSERAAREAAAQVDYLEHDVPLRVAALDMRIAELRAQREASVVRAPFAGTIYKTQAKKGEMVRLGDPLLWLADLEHLRVRANVDQVDLGRVRPGQPIRVTANAFPGRAWTGTVSDVVPHVVVKESRSVSEGLARLDPPTDGLVPGMTVDVEIVVAEDRRHAAGAGRGGADPGARLVRVSRRRQTAAQDGGAHGPLERVRGRHRRGARRGRPGRRRADRRARGRHAGAAGAARRPGGRVERGRRRERRMTRSAAPAPERMAIVGPAERPDAGTPLISLRGIAKTYQRDGAPVTALRGVDLDIHAGEFTAIMGRSGSGKSTLLHILGLLDAEYEGTLRVRRRARLRALARRAVAPAQSQDRLRLPVVPPAAAAHDPRERGAAGALRRRPPRRMPAPRRARASSRWASASASTTGRRSCRSANASAPRSRARWSTSRACSSPTSRPARSTAARREEILDILRELHRGGATVVLVTHDHEVGDAAERIIHIRDGQTDDGMA